MRSKNTSSARVRAVFCVALLGGAASLVAASSVFGIVGCSTTTTDTTTTTVVTSVAIDPADFLGTLECSTDPGAPQAYIATVIDVDTQNIVGTSPTMSCTLPVAFEDVTEDHKYKATISVYDVAPDQVTASTMPAWTTTCGTDAGAAVVNADERVFIHGCDALSGPGTNVTSIDIDTKSLAAPLGCTTDMGLLKGLQVEPITTSPGNLTNVILACGQGPVSYGDGLAKDTIYKFRVRGFAAGKATADWVSFCSAETRDGVRVDAACTPLSSYGEIRIDIAAILSAEKLECGGASGYVASYDVSFDGGEPTELDADHNLCANDTVIGPVASGSHGGEVTLRDAQGKRIGHAICFVDAVAGETTTAPCVPD